MCSPPPFFVFALPLWLQSFGRTNHLFSWTFLHITQCSNISACTFCLWIQVLFYMIPLHTTLILAQNSCCLAHWCYLRTNSNPAGFVRGVWADSQTDLLLCSCRLDASHSGAAGGQRHQGQLCHPVSAEVFRSRPKLWPVLVLSRQVRVWIFVCLAGLASDLRSHRLQFVSPD